MEKTFGKRVAIVAAAATVVVALSASVALAAPVLPYGTTSAPGMSGTCTKCHTYSKSSSTSTKTTTTVKKATTVVVSHPYTGKR